MSYVSHGTERKAGFLWHLARKEEKGILALPIKWIMLNQNKPPSDQIRVSVDKLGLRTHL